MDLEKEMEKEVSAPKKEPKKKQDPPKRFKVHTSNPNALLNLRSTPVFGDNIIGTIKNGTIVYGHGTNGAYTKIKYNDNTGYVLSSKLDGLDN